MGDVLHSRHRETEKRDWPADYVGVCVRTCVDQNVRYMYIYERVAAHTRVCTSHAEEREREKERERASARVRLSAGGEANLMRARCYEVLT